MKLFKKVLAMALASALALTLLVGCGGDGGKTTFTIVDYMNDVAVMMGRENKTYKADAEMDNAAKNVASVLANVGANDADELSKKVGQNEELQKSIMKAAGVNDNTVNKYLYELAYTFVASDIKTDIADAKEISVQQAHELLYNRHIRISTPEAAKEYHDPEHPGWGFDIDESKMEDTVCVGTAEVKVGNRTYLLVIFRTAVKAAK